MSGRAAGSSASTVIVSPTGDVADVPGQIEDRQRAAPAAAVEDHRLASQARGPEFGADLGHHAGSTRRNSSTSASVVSRCSETRMLPEVSAPIATSTCDGSSVDDVHDEPDETAKPAGRARPAAPRRRRRGRRT